MDVRQFAFMANQASAAVKPREHFWGMPKRGLAFLLANVMFWQPLWAQADGIVIATPGTSLGQAGNGVPIVNTATPNGAGLSHNQFHDYNVGAQGVILNNGSTQTLTTQLGGIIIGNPYLQNSGPAQTILNEVVGGNPSQLRGYTEVAGQSARVIVANPYGISCNGCGFINTPRVTLTTGKPMLDGSGRVERYQVDHGSVSIDGAGLNASNVDRFEIITRSAKINADIQAENLSLVAGRNDVNADSLNATARANDGSVKPDLAIDSSVLGGMYAGAIRLVGTEAGVGVKLDGKLIASGGDIQLDASGHLTLAQTSATGAVNVKAAGLDARGPVYAGSSLDVHTQGALANQQTLAARDSIALSAGGRLTNNGVIEAGINADNSRNATGDVSLSALNFSNTGKSVVASRNVSVNVGQTLNNQNGTLIAARTASITGSFLDNRGGRVLGDLGLNIDLSGALDNRNGLLGSGKSVGLQAASLDNRDVGVLVSDGMLNARIFGLLDNRNGGDISAKGAIEVRSGSLDNRGGKLIGKQAMALNSDSGDNSAGVIQADQQMQLHVGQMTNRDKGLISGKSDITFAGMGLDNSDGGKILAASDLKLVVANLVNQSKGQMVAKGATTLSGGSLDNSGGTFASLNGLVISLDDALLNRQGLISSEGLLSAHVGRLDNSGGTLSSAAALSATSRGALRNQGGSISADSTLNLASASLDNSQKGLIFGNASAEVVTGDIDNRDGGRLTAGATLDLTAKHVNNAGGRIASQGDLTASVAALDQRGGMLFSKNHLSLDLNHGQLNNQKGLINAPDLLLLKQLNGVNNQEGEISSTAAFTLAAQQLDNSNGKLLSDQSLSLQIARTLNNVMGTISAASINSHSASLNNAEGLINSRGSLEVRTDGHFDNQRGTVIADDKLLVDADTVDNRYGDISGKADAVVYATALDNRTGKLIATGVLKLTAEALDNRQNGLLGATNATTLTVDEIDNRGGEITTNDDLLISGRKLGNGDGGKIFSGRALTLTVDELINRNKGLLSAGANLLLLGHALDNSTGNLLSAQNMQLLLSGAFDNDRGKVSSEGALTVNTTQLINTKGSLSSASDLLLESSGSLNNQSGAIVTDGALTLTSASLDNRDMGSIGGKGAVKVITGVFDNSQSGRLTSAATLSLTAGEVTNHANGQVGSQDALTASVTGLDQNGGKLFSNSSLSLDLNLGQLNNQNGLINAPGALVLKQLSGVDNRGGEISSAEAFTLTAENLDNGNGKLLSNQGLTLRIAQALDNVKGLIGAASVDVHSASLNNSGGSLTSRGGLELTVDGLLRNDAKGLIHAAQLLKVGSAEFNNQSGTVLGASAVILNAMALNNRNSGVINSHGKLTLTATSLDSSDNGVVLAKGDIDLTLTSLTQNGGRLLGDNAITLELANGDFDNRNGLLTAKGPLTLKHLRDVDNQRGEISSTLGFAVSARAVDNSAGQIISNQLLTVNGSTLANQKGLISGWQGLIVSGDSLDNRDGGTLSSRNGDVAIDLKSALLNSDAGALVSQGNLSVKSKHLDNSHKGIISSAGGQTLSLDESLNNDGGLIDSGAALDITAGALTNAGGTINGQQAIHLTATGVENMAGSIASNGAVTLDVLGALNNTHGKLAGAGPVLIKRVTDLANQNGQLASQSTLTLLTGSLDNSNNGTIAAKNALQIIATGAVRNDANGLIYSQTAGLNLQAASLNNGKGAIQSQKGLALDISGDLDNQSGKVIAEDGALSVNAANIDNRGGVLSSIKGAIEGRTVGVLRNGIDLSNNGQGGIIQGQALTLLAVVGLDNMGGRISAQTSNANVATAAFDNRAGVLYAKALASVTGSNLNNANGQIAGDRIELGLSGLMTNRAGIVESGTQLSVKAASIDNQTGRLRSLGTSGKTEFQIGGLLDNRNGVLETANTDMTLGAGTFLNEGGELNHVGRGKFDIFSTNVLGAGGSITTGGLLELNADTWNNSSVIQAGHLNVNVRQFSQTASGKLLASKLLQVRGGSWTNDGLIASDGFIAMQLSGGYSSNGQMSSQLGLDFSAAQLNIGTAGSIAAGASSTVNLGGEFVNSGLITSSQDLTVSAGSFINSGTVGAAQDLNINTSSLLNDRGLIFSGNDMMLSVGNLTNLNGDFYSLGNVTIKGYGTAQADQVLNLSGSMESGKSFKIDAVNFANRTSGDDGTPSFALNRTLVSGFIAVQCGDCSGGTYDVNFIAREVFEGGQDNDTTASSLLTAGGDFTFNGGEFLNSKSTISASGNITINANNMRNVGAVSGSIERTRIFRAGGIGAGSFYEFMPEVVAYNQRNNPDFPNVYYIDGTGNFAQGVVSSGFDREKGHDGGLIRVIAIKDTVTDKSVSDLTLSGYAWGNTSLQSQYDPDNLVQMPTGLQGFTQTSDKEIARDGTSVASGRSAVIQAGGNVSITAAKDLQNSVIHEDYGFAGGTNKVGDTRVAGSGTTVIRINAQLPPDLAQQQVNPLSLPGFALPTGQNGLFRLSDQGASALVTVGGTPPTPGWSVSGENVSTLQRIANPATDGPRGLSVGSAASFFGSDPAVEPVKRSPISVNGMASALDVSVMTSIASTGGVSASRGTLPVSRVTGLPQAKAPASGHKYLIETNPVLTDLKQFMSSDYLLSNLGYDPDLNIKRLGDGLYEQRLIQQAVVARTGQRYIDGQTTDEGLFRYLMNNAIASKQTLNLAVGVTLTSEQVAALTHDIVWLEEHEVNGEKVLVPVLYLAQAEGRLGPNGTLIAGQNVTLIAGQNLDNVGTLKAANNLLATAGNNLVNSGLIQAGNRLDVLAGNDIINQSGAILAGRDVSATAIRGDVLNERSIIAQDSNTRFGTQHHDFVDSAARIEAANDLRVSAGQDINIVGGALQSGRDMDLAAGRDLNVVSTQVMNSVVHDANHNSGDITQLGSSLSAGRDLSAQAARDLNLIASQIDAKRDIAMAATENLTISSAADEEHSLSKSKKLTRQEDHVRQVMSGVTAGGDVALSAGENLAVISSRISAGDEAYLVAGDRIDILAAQDTDYSLYDKKKKGSFGSVKTQHDEVTINTHVGSEINAGGDLQLVSGGDQRYQAAKLESGKDIVIDSGGSVLFEGVKDLHDETHTKSDNDAFWNSSKGKGSTDETLRQTQMTAKGNIVIKAVDGLQIDIKEVNQQTVSQTIDAMVQADPQLAWLKQAEARGDVDWRQVKEIHESFKYSNSGLGPAAQLIIAIALAAVMGPMMAGMNAMLQAVAVTAATKATVSTIDNRGNLGKVVKDVTSKESLKSYATAAATAGVMQGLNYDSGTLRLDAASTQKVAVKITADALIKTAVYGGSLKDNLAFSAASVAAAIAGAGGADAIGDLHLIQGDLGKILLHAGLGGLLAEVMGGDFHTGALAGGANEALIAMLGDRLLPASLVPGSPEYNQASANLLALSQIVGVLGAAGSGGALDVAAAIAANATRYNFMGHQELDEFEEQARACKAVGNCEKIRQEFRDQSVNDDDALAASCAATPALCVEFYGDLLHERNSLQERLGKMYSDDSFPSMFKTDLHRYQLQNTSAVGTLTKAVIKSSLEMDGASPESAERDSTLLAAIGGFVVGKGVGTGAKATGEVAATVTRTPLAGPTANWKNYTHAEAVLQTQASGRLVNAEKAVIDPSKVTSYALNTAHPVGGNKAKVFEAALGYNQTNAANLITKVQEGAMLYPATLGTSDKFGQRITIDMPITGPNGNTATVRTGWIYDPGSATPRMTTLYVK